MSKSKQKEYDDLTTKIAGLKEQLKTHEKERSSYQSEIDFLNENKIWPLESEIENLEDKEVCFWDDENEDDEDKTLTEDDQAELPFDNGEDDEFLEPEKISKPWSHADDENDQDR